MAEIYQMVIDGDKDTPQVKKAKNAVNNGLTSGKMKRPDKCDKCKAKTRLEAHHHKGYDDENLTNVQWLCIPCHKAADNKLRAAKRKAKGDDMPEDITRLYDHVDLMRVPPEHQYGINFLEDTFKETDEGYLTGRAIVTNIGIFPYMNSDESIRRELRHPEDVFDAASLESIKSKIITNGHPEVMVDKNNTKELQVGFTSDEVFIDPYHISINITITDAQTIQDIKDGKRSLSCGYRASLTDEHGTYQGIPYDARQKNIRYNHIAIVDRGRAGDAARIKMDGVDSVAVALVSDINITEDTMPDLKKIKLDGVEYQAEGRILEKLSSESKRADEAEAKLETESKKLKEDAAKLEADNDTLKEKSDALELKVKELEANKMDEGTIQKAVQVKLELLADAKSTGAEVKVDMDSIAIKEAAVLKMFPSSKEKLDEKKDSESYGVYLDARYDAALEEVKNKNDGKTASIVTSGHTDHSDGDKLKSDEARQKHWDSLINDSRPKGDE